MSYLYGRAAAAVMLSAALAVRLFIGMAVDHPVALNAAWMCPLIGFLIYLPLGLAIGQCDRLGNAGTWENVRRALPSFAAKILEGIFALMLAYDAASSIRLTASSSNIIALGDVSVHLLIVPLMIVTAAVVWMGGDALGDAARIALRILPLFALIVLLVQIAGYRFGWLMPLLGGGFGGIIEGSIYCAGCMALMSLIWLPAIPDRHRNGMVRYVFIPAAAISILLATQQMSYPVMPHAEFTQAARIEMVLSNGRMSLYPQFILNILWYGGLLVLLAAEAVGAAAYIHRMIPGMKTWLLAIAIAAAVSAAAIYNPSWLKKSTEFTGLLFPFIGGLFALPLIEKVFSFRGKNRCKGSE